MAAKKIDAMLPQAVGQFADGGEAVGSVVRERFGGLVVPVQFVQERPGTGRAGRGPKRQAGTSMGRLRARPSIWRSGPPKKGDAVKCATRMIAPIPPRRLI